VASYSAEVGLRKFSATLYPNGTPIGYSYKTNQYGLSVDSIVGFNLVLPNGTVTYVTRSTYPDLFFGLKGGFNNFVSHSLKPNPHSLRLTGFQGIVTDFTMATFPQTDVWVRAVHSLLFTDAASSPVSGRTDHVPHSQVR